MKEEGMERVDPSRVTKVLIGVDGGASGKEESIRETADAQRRKGQRMGSPDLRWVWRSILMPFFWSMNVMVTYDARRARYGSE